MTSSPEAAGRSLPRLAAILLAGLVAATAPAAEAAPLTSAKFRTPSRNIGCAFSRPSSSSAYLRCDILSGLRPEPRRACDFDWVGLALTGRGRGRPNCGSDTVYAPRAPVLRYGRTWRRGPFLCVSGRRGLRCTNQAAHGFFLSRRRWRVY